MINIKGWVVNKFECYHFAACPRNHGKDMSNIDEENTRSQAKKLQHQCVSSFCHIVYNKYFENNVWFSLLKQHDLATVAKNMTNMDEEYEL